MTLHERFNRSGFSRFLNSRAGVAFRLTAGSAFLIVGFLYRSHPLGIASMVWSFFPLTAGAFDWCYISALLGGPFSGKTIRSGEGSS
jgi:hypothetical protein